MESLPVTLIVKAPNQQFEDQTIKCEPTWSIRKLKGYLSEVYPCNPSLEEQKLIYSGQLLNDAHILKDVLRQYEGQETHTVHLVYTPKNQPPTSHSSQSARNASTTTSSPQTSQPQPTIGRDGLRQRIASTTSNTSAASSSMAPAPQPAPSPFANPFGYMANPYGGGPAPQMTAAQQQFAAQQMAVQSMMQQMYVQYMGQMAAYSQQWQSAAAAGQPQPPTFVPQPFNLQTVNVPTVEPTPTPPPAAAPPGAELPANDNMADAANVAAAAAAARPAAQAAADEEADNRDWLETLYTLSRLAILLSLVYFYSSPGRCSIVIVCIGLYYWYQHHQRNQRQQQADPAHEGEADVIENNERDNDANAAPNAPAPEADAPNAAPASSPASSNGAASTAPTDTDENRLTTMALLRTFISSFFASLIPETPAV